MEKKRLANFILIAGILSVFVSVPMAFAISDAYKGNIYQTGTLKPIDSVLKVKVGRPAPNFHSPFDFRGKYFFGSISGEKECCPLLCSCGLDPRLFGSMAWLQYRQRYF